MAGAQSEKLEGASSLHRGRGLPVGQGRSVTSNEAFSWQPTTHPPLPSFPLILPVQAPVSDVWLSKFQKIEEGLQWIKDEKDKTVDVKIKALEDQVNALNGLYHDGYDDRPSNIREMPENLDSPISSKTDSTMFTKEDLAASKRKHSDQEDIKLLQMIRRVLGKKVEATSSQVNGSSHATVHAIANQEVSQPTTIPAVANGVIHDSAALQPIDRRKSSDPIQTARNVREASPLAIQEVNALQTRRFDITIHVAGAGIDAVNGEYRQISQGSVFVQVHTSNHIMRIPSFGMNNEKWIICDVVGTFETERDAMIEAVYYSCPCQDPPGAPPPEAGWQIDKWGVGPAPSLKLAYQMQDFSATNVQAREEVKYETYHIETRNSPSNRDHATAEKPSTRMNQVSPQFHNSFPTFFSTKHHRIAGVKSWNSESQTNFNVEVPRMSGKTDFLQKSEKDAGHMSLQEEMVLNRFQEATNVSSQNMLQQPVHHFSSHLHDEVQRRSDQHPSNVRLQNAGNRDQTPENSQEEWTDLVCDSVMMRMSRDSDGSSAGVGVSLKNSTAGKQNPFVLGGTDVSKLNKKELAAVLQSCFLNNKTAQLVVRNMYGTKRVVFLERSKDNSGLGMILNTDRVTGGTVVQGLQDHSPASRAGIMIGDSIVSLHALKSSSSGLWLL
ncbi:hypothetical protein GUITHDRAFT_134543 [Guillardia theta CCMP2712]|uniref:PDZ domain-containing protein n=1 Tax=Guillardia theta (strain CCMP2712) TaxID=905079 RepID=L1JU86_GUITC|nr:hypothetical protein GUITHDRAFT_134543 [Guillardia theta CCMP2712]EKX51653.1 hypothetical protein GUITHDRAFT_134543 [Guillardia theta CCMP2712]|eukprot:XP_005838633.1 hypothetical protein GUITHDRAFT_134543 [Guillardia theta CCMP2712]